MGNYCGASQTFLPVIHSERVMGWECKRLWALKELRRLTIMPGGAKTHMVLNSSKKLNCNNDPVFLCAMNEIFLFPHKNSTGELCYVYRTSRF